MVWPPSTPLGLSRALVGLYERLTRSFSGTKSVAYIIAGIAILALAVSYPVVRSAAVLPEFQDADLMIDWATEPGTSGPEMSRITTAVVREIRAIPGVRNAGAHLGRAVTSDQVVGVSSGQIWVNIDTEADYRATVESVEDVLKNYPGLEYDTSTYSEHRIEMTRGRDDDKVVVRVYGQDSDVLSVEGQKLKDLVSGIEGVTEVEVPKIPMEPTVEIRVNLTRAMQYGIKPGDVRRAAATLLSGLEVGSLFEEKKVFDVVVWGTPETRSDLSSVRNLLLQSPGGRYVRLGEVADVRVVPHPVMIKREGVARYVDVEIDVAGRDLGGVAKEVGKRLETYPLPAEYHAEVLGSYARRGRVDRSALTVSLAAVIGIFFLLQAAFRSWRLALVVVLTVPVAVLGGVAFILLTEARLNLAGFCGLIVVCGLALRAATLLITHYQRLERVEGVSFGPDLVARGTLERAHPTLASAFAIALIFLPGLLFRGKPGLEFIGPIAGVVLCGLVTTIVFALFVLPQLYLAWGAHAATEEDFEDLQKGAVHV
jgi:Cu/Ag efflux pump CusA